MNIINDQYYDYIIAAYIIFIGLLFAVAVFSLIKLSKINKKFIFLQKNNHSKDFNNEQK